MVYKNRIYLVGSSRLWMFVSREGKDREDHEDEDCQNDGSDGALLCHLSGMHVNHHVCYN